MKKPNYMVIGAQKGGTTAFQYHFNLHPDIYMKDGEPHFFDKHISYKKGIKYYEGNFTTNKKYIGEKTPSYIYLRHAIDRIYKNYPNIKLIIVLREPVSRAYSQYNMSITTKPQKFKNFIQSIKDIENVKLCNIKDNGYWALQRGFYVDQIEYILSKFPKENVYISIFEENKNNSLDEYNKIFQFIGAKPLQKLDINDSIRKGKYDKPISKKDFLYLYNIYKPYNERLYNLLGRRIDSWEQIYGNLLDSGLLQNPTTCVTDIQTSDEVQESNIQLASPAPS